MAKVEKIMRRINKKHGKDGQEVINFASQFEYNFEKIPFSSPRASYLSYGGIPRGKMTEFSGAENSGKTTSALDIVKNVQKELKEKESNRKVVYIDAEHTLDLMWVENLGVDINNLILHRPQAQSAEDILQLIIDFITSGEVDLVVLDSLPMLISDKLLDEDISAQEYAGIAAPLTRFCRNVVPPLSKVGAGLIIVNQMRSDLSNPYNIYHTPGGKALKHNFALRIYFRRGKYLEKIDSGYNELSNNAVHPVGNKVDMKLVKTKICRPDRRTSFYTLNYTEGIDYFYDTIDVAVELNLLLKGGSWYRIVDPETGEIITDEEGEEIKIQGMNNLAEFLENDIELYDKIYKKVNELLIK